MKIIKEKSGFTLIEVLVAMSIFVVFVGILINSYSSIVRAYNQANDYRKMYVEARDIFDAIKQELRDSVYDYAFEGNEGNVLISKDGQYRTKINHSDNNLSIEKCSLSEGLEIGDIGAYGVCEDERLNLDLEVTEFKFLASPIKDPYNDKNIVNNNVQFQPMIHVYAKFKYVDYFGDESSFDLQTSVSSRIYNQVYEVNELYE